MNEKKKQDKNIQALDKAIQDALNGNDLSWARVYPSSKVMRVAVHADDSAGRDLEWARKNKVNRVRASVASCDIRKKRDREWMRNDTSPAVRKRFAYVEKEK